MNLVSSDYLDISIKAQSLRLIENGQITAEYSVSTARNGAGERKGSECTPTGWHQIRAKIGAHAAPNSVFVGRRATGEIFTTELAAQFPQRDWILSRILWLSGLEAGKNRYHDVDSAWRYIYIHGTAEEDLIGQPSSHGCIRMRNVDIIDLFQRVQSGFKVWIHD